MNEHNEQTSTQTSPLPAPITLEGLIEAVREGVTRALDAQDDTGGYLYRANQGANYEVPKVMPPIVVLGGMWAHPPSGGVQQPSATAGGGSRQ